MQLLRNVPYVDGLDNYTLTLVDLVHDALYTFRVDIRQMAPGGKEMKEIMQGKNSVPALIPCTGKLTRITELVQ